MAFIVALSEDKNYIKVFLTSNDRVPKGFSYLIGPKKSVEGNFIVLTVPATPLNSFVLRFSLKKNDTVLDKETSQTLSSLANKVPKPLASLDSTGRFVNVTVPRIRHYTDILSKLNAYPVSDGTFRLDLSRVPDIEYLSGRDKTSFPKIVLEKDVTETYTAPIEGFDGTLDSLRSISVDVLNIVKADKQTYRNRKASSKSLAEKMSDLGISTLYDLLFWLPRKYIDKSNPQDSLKDLVEGETAVVVGEIENVSEISYGRGGASFTVRTGKNDLVRASFFNQKWLLQRFRVGDKVLVTGKLGWWNGVAQIGGSSIEHSEEADILPIVPVYKQSPSKGLTTFTIMSACREMLSRIKNITLPDYVPNLPGMSFFEAVSLIHFPESIKDRYRAIRALAFWEMVYIQVIVQSDKDSSSLGTGLSIAPETDNLSQAAESGLPYSLTGSQKKALKIIKKQMARDKPSTILLNADVGSGKTVVAHLSSLYAVDSGFQVAIAAPTDVLARQLYKTCVNVTEGLDVTVELLSGTMKASERKEVCQRISSGEVQIVVGTHALFTKNISFKNLGFVVVDEQQKFGVLQREALLSSRADGKIPDMLMMTATPVPRSTAQVFYGDINMIELKEKPPGRLPIETVWIKEDPSAILSDLSSIMWQDIRKEAEKGNQTFIIAPLVIESDKIDAASVEKSYKTLSSTSLSGLRVGFVHGKMKQDEQNSIMEDFRAKKYDVLVASTVVEVGVDIPDATRVVILSADRLGSSSLHQIRGRVGRNSKPSKCYLVSLGQTSSSESRLSSLVESNDGFEIAKKDLELRGEGKIFGEIQSGKGSARFVSVVRHAGMIDSAKKAARSILVSENRSRAIKDAEALFEL